MPFKVISKDTGIAYDVYVVNDTKFLIFCDGSFGWWSMYKFRPVSKTEQEIHKEDNPSYNSMFRSQKRKEIYP